MTLKKETGMPFEWWEFYEVEAIRTEIAKLKEEVALLKEEIERLKKDKKKG